MTGIVSKSYFQMETFAGICLSAGVSQFLGPLSWAGFGTIAAGGQILAHGFSTLAKLCTRSVRAPQRSITDVDQVVAKIKELKKNHKICLFIGKQPHEPLPAKQYGTVWVSLDLHDDEDMNTPQDRLHLMMDGRDEEAIKKINGLFHEVVFDASTWKFFGGTDERDEISLQRFSKLLDSSDPEATLITDFGRSIIGLEEIDEAVLDVLVQQKLETRFPEILSEKEIKSLYEKARYECRLIPQFKKINKWKELRYDRQILDFLPSQIQTVRDRSWMLRRYFKNVERVTDKPHPYPNLHRSDETHYLLRLKHTD